MNYGNLGFITKNGDISLGQDILTTLCLDNNSKLYGLYYPCPPEQKDPHYKDVTIRHDIMLTTIPPRFWPICCRINIFMLQARGSMNEICKFFKKNKISIVHAESSRSTYRYATWSLHIIFQDLLGKRLKFDKDKNWYIETYRRLDRILKKMIKELFPDYLFNPDYHRPVEGMPNSSLAYFANYISSKPKWIKNRILLEPFELTLQNKRKHHLLIGNHTFKKILDYLDTIGSGDDRLFPSTIFCELDSRDLNVRLVPMSNNNRRRFFKLKIEYTRKSQPDNGIGILHTIVDNWLPNYNVWHSYNYIMQSDKAYESGAMVLLIEHVSDNINDKNYKDERDVDDYIKEAYTNISGIVKSANMHKGNIVYQPPKIFPMPEPSIIEKIFDYQFEERSHRKFVKDLFISYSHLDEEFVLKKLVPVLKSCGVDYFLDKKELEYGDEIANVISSSITHCREMCVIISEHSEKSTWVITETGAAWILEMPLVPISIKASDTKYFDLIYNRYIVDGNDVKKLKKYASQVINRRDKHVASIFKHQILK